MKVVNAGKPVVNKASLSLPNGYMRVYNKIDGSSIDVHTVDALDYVRKLPHLWSISPIAKEQAKAEDAVIVPEPAKEAKPEVEKTADAKTELKSALDIEEKTVSARSRRLAKLED